MGLQLWNRTRLLKRDYAGGLNEQRRCPLVLVGCVLERIILPSRRVA